MTKYLFIVTLVFLASCGQTKNNSDKNDVVVTDTVFNEEKITSEIKIKLTDKTVKFLWRADKYDEALKDTFNSIFIDEDFCKSISDPEKAALGYVATYIGSECQWDGEANEDRSNLKCKILTSLNFGYQCSDRHIGFLQKWFKNDKKVLDELNDNCPTIPFTASSQETFGEITLTVKGNQIAIWYSVSGVNIPMGATWDYSETDYFQVHKDNIQLLKKDKSKIKRGHFDTGE